MRVRTPSRAARRAAAELRCGRAAGTRSEERGSNQLCVVCQGKKVVPCSICGGSGEDALAEYVEGVRSATCQESDAPSAATIMVEDWDSGPQQARPRRSWEGGWGGHAVTGSRRASQVLMFQDILKEYPPKMSQNCCANCEARGVTVCTNCNGQGIQPRFLDRFDADDFDF